MGKSEKFDDLTEQILKRIRRVHHYLNKDYIQLKNIVRSNSDKSSDRSETSKIDENKLLALETKANSNQNILKAINILKFELELAINTIHVNLPGKNKAEVLLGAPTPPGSTRNPLSSYNFDDDDDALNYTRDCDTANDNISAFLMNKKKDQTNILPDPDNNFLASSNNKSASSRKLDSLCSISTQSNEIDSTTYLSKSHSKSTNNVLQDQTPITEYKRKGQRASIKKNLSSGLAVSRGLSISAKKIKKNSKKDRPAASLENSALSNNSKSSQLLTNTDTSITLKNNIRDSSDKIKSIMTNDGIDTVSQISQLTDDDDDILESDFQHITIDPDIMDNVDYILQAELEQSPSIHFDDDSNQLNIVESSNQRLDSSDQNNLLHPASLESKSNFIDIHTNDQQHEARRKSEVIAGSSILRAVTSKTNAVYNKRYATIRKAINMYKNIEDDLDAIDEYIEEKATADSSTSQPSAASVKRYNTKNRDSKIAGNKFIDTKSPSLESPAKEQLSRKEIIVQFYNHERSYIECVYVCNMFRKAIQKAGQISSTAIISTADYKKLFAGIDQISTFHTVWQPLIENKIKSDSVDILIADFFISLEERFPLYRSVMQNYVTMLEILAKNRTNEKFNAMMSKQISIINSKEALSFEAILAKINNRIHYYFISLDEILKNTSETHVEYLTLNKLRNDFLIFFEIVHLNREKKIFNRDITNSATVVELVGEKKKHRLLFFYSDVIVVASENIKKNTITVRWYCSFKKTKINENYKPKLTEENKEDIDKLKALIGNNRSNLKNECAQPKRKAQNIEKLERTLADLETQLIFALATHPLVLSAVDGKSIILLFSTKKEADNWNNAIKSRISYPLMEEWPISSNEVQLKLDLICKQVDKVTESLGDKSNNNYDNAILAEIFSGTNKDDSLVTGALKIKYVVQYSSVTSSNSTSKLTDLSFDIEIDSYSYFFKQFKSKPIKPGETLSDIVKMSVEKCLCLKIIFNQTKTDLAETLEINLIEENVKGCPFITKRFIVNDCIKMVVFIEYATTIQKFDKIMTPVDMINHFMINVSNITSTEYTDIPSVVRICCETIEENGIDVVGIYRISGVSSQINNLKKEWESNLITCVEDLKDYDIHAVSGLLKMFFRDLDEKLVPTMYTSKFIAWYRLSRAERTHQALLDIAATLPKTNYTVFEYLIKHILAISKMADVNKMTISNLSTVFGPNIFSEKGIDNSEGVVLIVSVFKDVLESYSQTEQYLCSE